jgi:pimeloyl-[acyl-carrier protein] methyl ester esterase
VPEGALWLGWSLGGLFALQAALTRPDLRGLVLAASSPRFVAAPDWPRGTPASALAGFADDLRNDYAGTIGRFLALDLVDAPGNPQALRRQLLERGAPEPQAIRDGLDVIQPPTCAGAGLAAGAQPVAGRPPRPHGQPGGNARRRRAGPAGPFR